MNNIIKIATMAVAFGVFATGCSDPLLEEPVKAPPVTTDAVDVSSIIMPGKALVPNPNEAAQIQTPAEGGNQFPEGVANEQTLHTINMFLLEYQANGGRIPATVEEMVSLKIVPKIPPPPIGKRFEVDQQRAVITFADI